MREECILDGVRYENMSPDRAVFFREHDHKYILADDKDFKFNSVTTLIHEYGEHFDAVAISEMVSKKKDSEYYGMTPEEIRQKWIDASTIGTMLHEYGENLLNYKNGGKFPKPDAPDHVKAKFVEEIVDDLKSKGYELAITELLVYDLELKLAGQSDILLKKKYSEDSEYKYQIYDWKFLKEPVKKKSYYNPVKRRYKMMNGPFKHLMDCNWIHYSIQLSIYQTLSGAPEMVTEKVLVVVNEDGWSYEPCYPMRVFWDTNGELQCVHETWNGKWYDSRTDKITLKKPRDIVGIV